MPRPSHRDTIINAGVDTLYRRGFGGTGVREIAAAAAVPQGSFTNHFRSKEAFGRAVLDRYFDEVIVDFIVRTLRNDALSPLERLSTYFEAITNLLNDAGWRYGCLIGNMSLEQAEHSEATRKQLGEMFRAWTEPFTEAVRAAQGQGQVRSDLDAHDVADFLLNSWHGAILRMKVDRDRRPLDVFRTITFTTVLRPPPTKSGQS